MNATCKSYAFLLGVLLIAGCQDQGDKPSDGEKSFSNAPAQEGTKDWRPFVKLSARVNVRVYKDPIIRNGEPVDEGVLLDDVKKEEFVGSGTVVTRDGLILTNYHVAQVVLGESGSPFEDNNKLFYKKTIPLNRDVMLVYELDAQDYLKEPALKYQAKFLAGHRALDPRLPPDLDVAVLKIHALADGTPIARQDFASVPLGDPYGIPVNAVLNVIGYPGVAGKLVTPTVTHFSGYTKGAPKSRDGAFVTVSTISGGNSGRTVLYEGRHVGIPTKVVGESNTLAAFGVIHPVTWAIEPFARTALRDRQQIPQIDPKWVQSEHNSDIARTHIFLGGKILSAASSKPVAGALVVFHRDDRTYSQINALREEIGLIYFLQRKLGMQPPESALSEDVKRYAKDEFFFAVDKTSERSQADGFFFVAVPRKQKLKVVVSANGYRDVPRDEEPRDGLFADVGEIKMFPPMSAPAALTQWIPPGLAGRSPFLPSSPAQ